MNAKRTYLYGARVIVTGASDGIGKEIVRLLVGRFNCIVLGIARGKDKLAALKTELGENFDYIAGDVTDKSLWERIAGKFDDEPYSVLVNNAGIMPPLYRRARSDRRRTAARYRSELLRSGYRDAYSFTPNESSVSSPRRRQRLLLFRTLPARRNERVFRFEVGAQSVHRGARRGRKRQNVRSLRVCRIYKNVSFQKIGRIFRREKSVENFFHAAKNREKDRLRYGKAQTPYRRGHRRESHERIL